MSDDEAGDGETSPEELAALLGAGADDVPASAPGKALPPEHGPAAPDPEDDAAPSGGEALVDQATRYPVTVLVGVLLIALFGLQALFSVPIQLTPDVTRPVITVETVWPGANPQEVEREIVDEQEEYLKSLEGLVRMKSEASPSLSRITLEFVPGTVLDTALVKVNNKLNQVPSYPPEAERPVLQTAGAREDAIGWFILLPREEGSSIEIEHLLDFVEDEVEARFERVPGVAAANVFGGREREVAVIVDPDRLAARRLTFQDVADALARENVDASAGHLDEGKRRYNIRSLGAFTGTLGVEDIVVREDLVDRVFLRDVARVQVDYKDPSVVVRHKGVPAIAVNAQRQIGSNVLEVMDGIQEVMEDLNAGLLKERGLVLEQAYDSSEYIRGALDVVQSNILLGGTLAILVLLIFLRSVRPTLIIAIAIPVSAVGTFLAMFLLGRNVNVVSLAGLSFAVGMLVDNSIVVLENIFTHLQEGADRRRAAVRGTVEVWGAIFASTATTVAVFLPIFFIEAEIAQLFRDIAIAICCAVVLSLVVSVTVIPMLASRWMRETDEEGLAEAAVDAGDRFRDAIVDGVHRLCGSTPARLATVVVLTLAVLGGTWWIAPPAEYLPSGNRNLIFGILIPPSGYNLEEFERIGEQIEGDLGHLWSGEDPAIRNFFYVAFGRQVFMGAQATDPDQIGELMPQIQGALSKVPGMIAIVLQAGLFDQGLEGGRSAELEIKGPSLETLVGLAGRAFGGVMQHLPGAQARPVPGLELGQPELQILPDRRALVEAGFRPQELGFLVDALADGVQVSEVRMPDGKEVDLTLKGDLSRLEHTQDLGDVPVFLPSGSLAPVRSLGTLQISMGPDQINHSERERTISLVITPPADTALQTAMEVIEEKIVGPMLEDGSLEPPYSWRIAGTADKLTSTRKALQAEFLTAVAVTYLLMASLFESFLFPFVILFSVPLASFGGFALLRVVNAFNPDQRLDVLAMLGFVILVGIVVNNAILIVDRTLRNVRDAGDTPRDAVAEAVSNRIRPIFMSTLTSVFGMAPLILMTGPGSELYRGIGSVVVGGLLFSTVFTLVLIPALLSLVLEARLRLFPDEPL